jgi:hypothetical protein
MDGAPLGLMARSRAPLKAAPFHSKGKAGKDADAAKPDGAEWQCRAGRAIGAVCPYVVSVLAELCRSGLE